LGSSAQTIYGDIDKTMLARIGSVGVAGIYTGAYRIIGMAATPVLAFVYAANPRLFRDGKREPREVWSLACRATRYSAAYASVVGLACVLAAPLVPHVLGRSFDGSVAVLRWLAVLPVIQAVHVVAANALMGVGRQALRSGVQLGVAGLNIGLNVWLIPAYSWRGAAVATLISEGALAVGVLGLLYLTVDARARALQGARLDRVTEALS
jgi:O-antigen/teichoic acid export membrane protein